MSGLFNEYADTIQALSDAEIGRGHAKSYMKKEVGAQAEFLLIAWRIDSKEIHFLSSWISRFLTKWLRQLTKY